MGELGFAQSGIGFPDAEQGGAEGTPFFKVSDMNTPGNEYELAASKNYVTAEQIARMGWHPLNQVPAIFFAKVGAAVMLNRKRLVNEPFLLDNNTMAFSMDSSLLDTQFGQSLFERLDLTSLIQVGALPSFNSSDVESISVSLPSTMDEQRQIGQYLCNLNTLITLHQRKYDKLVVFKKSMLEKMFPKDGESVPEIRFAGFTDPWEQRKLGDVTDSFSGGTPDGSHASYYGGSIPFIRSAEINSDKTELFLTEKGLDNSSAKIVERGTVLYALYGATSGEVGIAAIKGAINQAILALSPHTGNDPLFLASWLRREKARIVDTYLQGGQGNLSGSIVKELSFALPQQKEQQVIGSFFSRLDSLITLHQRKLELLQNIKKSLLDKMFV